MAVKRKKKHRAQYLPPISGIDKYSRITIEHYLRELNRRVKLPKDEVITLTTYKYGRRRYYRVVIKRVSDGAIVDELGSFTRGDLSSALALALRLIKKVK